MYRLLVSYNCGISYRIYLKAEEIKDLESKCNDLDARGLRWVIEDEHGNPQLDSICAIYAGILGRR